VSNQLLGIEGLLQHAGWLRRVAAALVGDRDAAQDVAQETLLAAWRRPPESDRDVRPWLVHVARNNARGRARADNSRKACEQVAGGAAAGEVSTPEQLVGSAEIHRAVAEIVSRLQPALRETVVMRYYDGLSSEEIARRQQLPAGTVRARLKRALDEVRAELDARHGGDRRTWLRALLPLVPVQPPPGWSLARKGASVALGAAAVAVTAVAVVAVLPQRTSAPREPAAARGHAAALMARARPGAPAPPGGQASHGNTPAPAPASIVAAASACPERLRRAHEELVALEADLVDWDQDFLFALGAPNPTAEAALAPLLVPALVTERWRVLEHRLRCRTWACRMTVLFTEPRSNKPYGSADRYRKALRLDGALAARASDVQGDFQEWAEDLVAAEGSFLYVVQLRLRQPSGAPLPDAQLTPPARPLVVPPTAPGCEAAAAALDRELPSRRARWEEVEPIDQRFERSQEPPDPALVEAVQAHQPWFSDLLAVTECRGRVCKQTNRYPLLGRTFWDKPAGNGRKVSRGSGPDSVVYHELAPPR
jgi:RNA polymerase sigma-70 factor (ECF subfamily)